MIQPFRPGHAVGPLTTPCGEICESRVRLANAREWDRYSTPERRVVVRSTTAARLGLRRDLVLRH